MDTTGEIPRRLTRRAALRAGATAGLGTLLGASTIRARTAQATTADPIEPRAGTWKPWLLEGGNQFRLGPPPDGRATDGELLQMRDTAGRRDAAALDRVAYWDAGPAPFRWNDIFIRYSNVTN